jgi:hypothetical protein
MELPTGPLEGLVGRPLPAWEPAVGTHRDRPVGRLLERGLRREFDDVEVLLIAVDAVGWVLDAVVCRLVSLVVCPPSSTRSEALVPPGIPQRSKQFSREHQSSQSQDTGRGSNALPDAIAVFKARLGAHRTVEILEAEAATRRVDHGDTLHFYAYEQAPETDGKTDQ